MLNIIKSNSHSIIRSHEEQDNLTGFNSTLLSILLNSYTRTIKLEGFHKIYSENPEPYWDIVSVKEGKLLYYHSYAKANLGEYHKIKADLLLTGHTTLDPERVVRYFIKEKGLYNKTKEI